MISKKLIITIVLLTIFSTACDSSPGRTSSDSTGGSVNHTNSGGNSISNTRDYLGSSNNNTNNVTQVKVPSSPGRIPGDVAKQVTFLPGGGDGSCITLCTSGDLRGNTLMLTKFPAHQSLRFIVYADPSGKFVTEWTAMTDSSGEVTIVIENGDTENYAIAIINNNTGEILRTTRNMVESITSSVEETSSVSNPSNNVSSNNASSNQQSSNPANITCSGAPPTRLNIGFRARVTYTDGTPGSVRSAPASANILGEVPEGVGMNIIGGPQCDNSRVWWRVETDNGYTGWISEGKPGEYWLEPAN